MTPIEHYMQRARRELSSSPVKYIEALYNDTKGSTPDAFLIDTARKEKAILICDSIERADEFAESFNIRARVFRASLRGEKILLHPSLLREVFHWGNALQFTVEQILNWIELSRRPK